MNFDTDNKPTIGEVDKILDKIRPHLETDGGDIRVLDVTDEMTVRVELLGNCQACTLSGMTLKNGVEAVLKSHFPHIREVIDVNAKK